MADADIPTNFKTSLPPRKRAKTKEEKEQRRIERILRNRKAAHASREKKRKHVEFLESYVLDLEKQMHLVKQLNEKLLSEYKGNDSEVEALTKKVASLPDLHALKLQHVSELDGIGCEAEEDEDEDDTVPTQANSPKGTHSFLEKTFTEEKMSINFNTCIDDVPELEESRNMSQSGSDSETYSPYVSEYSSPMTVDKFSLDIITAEPESTGLSVSSNDIFVKKETFDDFIPKSNDIFVKKETFDDFIPKLLPTDYSTTLESKMAFDEFQVKMNDEQFAFDELRNPAVIAAGNLMKTIFDNVCAHNKLFLR